MTQATQRQSIQLQIEIDAPPKRVFEALTRNDQLAEWFCEASDVSPGEKRYDFWGRYTPERPPREDGRHPLRAIEPEKKIAFEWTVRGGPTQVEFALEPQGGGTSLSVSHSGLRPRAREEASLTDWWGHCLENLKSWLEKRAMGPRRDFAAAPSRPFEISIGIDAPPEKVFRALTDPKELERWIAEPGKAVVEPRVGGRYDFGWGDEGGPIGILEITPYTRLSYSWRFEGEPDTVVTWTLDGSGGKSQLVLKHVGFTDDSLFDSYATGWGKFLNRVKHLVEGGPDWKRAVAASTDF